VEGACAEGFTGMGHWRITSFVHSRTSPVFVPERLAFASKGMFSAPVGMGGMPGVEALRKSAGDVRLNASFWGVLGTTALPVPGTRAPLATDLAGVAWPRRGAPGDSPSLPRGRSVTERLKRSPASP